MEGLDNNQPEPITEGIFEQMKYVYDVSGENGLKVEYDDPTIGLFYKILKGDAEAIPDKDARTKGMSPQGSTEIKFGGNPGAKVNERILRDPETLGNSDIDVAA